MSVEDETLKQSRGRVETGTLALWDKVVVLWFYHSSLKGSRDRLIGSAIDSGRTVAS